MQTIALANLALLGHTWLNARLLRVPAADVPPTHGLLATLLLPVRDEAPRVTACLTSLLEQGHPVLVLDDGSSDGTGELVRNLGVEPLTGRPLPAGWLGKPWACQQLADAAVLTDSDVLVFVDADVVLAPGAVDASLALLEKAGLDLVSPYPRQLADGAIRLVQPLLQWSWLTFLPLRLAERGSASLSAANGQVLCVRRGRYDRAGGHAAVRDEVVEDVALLRAVKRAGGSGGVVDGTSWATCRMYGSWSELADGYAKSLHTVPVPALVLLAALYLVPPLAAVRGSRAGALATVAGVAGRAVAARRTGSPVLDAVAHPLSVATLLGLAARSHLLRARGRLSWKGRSL